ncbi:cytochrome P450 oxidoreductase [Capronia epimyces CBS 606.96]|uniref:Cytochrome P450 oxidoreductase n=1 Tax=Capronia epimyces CBS 606.96 TaxID=1182542 RepID=W9XHE6_9EURO|nr:cytochrome P450 oxidoreductase [Capronia epimyces CBS 606.96]EXJ79927.1 cytochrome P450 oxidoreductase [Capronia epimyces CBS 606.96]
MTLLSVSVWAVPLFVGTVIYFLASVLKVGRRAPGLPPGPPTLPIIGNLHQMPSKNPHLQFQKWAQEYGPVYSLILGTKTMVVLSSDQAVKDLLDKKSAIYSDRPDMFIGQKIASGNLRLVVMRYGDNWRMIHKMVHNILNIKAAVTYVPYQDLENKMLLTGLLDSPDEFLNHIRRFSYSLATQMIFGVRCPDINDPNIQQLFWSFEHWGELAGSASAQLVDLYPILQKLPRAIAPNVRYAENLHEIEKKLYVGLWMQAKRGLENGTGLPCFCNDVLRAQQTEKFTDDAAGYMSGSLLEAGSDTTSSTLYGFIQAMLVWPEVQKKAQAEIDRVVGPDRLPTMDDYDQLHYIRCCMKESLRWMPTIILGVPHASTKDDTYGEYIIPKGSTVVANVWAIHMDPNRCPEPRRFNPDRFKDDFTTLYQSANGDPAKRDNFNFGAGRRLCQGIHIAERSLFLGISRLLWGFNVSKPLDKVTGKPITPDIDDFVGSLTVIPRPYKAVIEPRSPERTKVMRDAWADAQNLLDPVTKQWKKMPEGMALSTWMPEKIDV